MQKLDSQACQMLRSCPISPERPRINPFSINSILLRRLDQPSKEINLGHNCHSLVATLLGCLFGDNGGAVPLEEATQGTQLGVLCDLDKLSALRMALSLAAGGCLLALLGSLDADVLSVSHDLVDLCEVEHDIANARAASCTTR